MYVAGSTEAAGLKRPALSEEAEVYSTTTARLAGRVPVYATRREENWSQIQFLLGHASVQMTERSLGCKQRFQNVSNDSMGIESDQEAKV